MRFYKEYEQWAVVHEAAKLACKVGLSKLFEQIEAEYIDLQWLSDPRSYGPDRDDVQEYNG